MKKYAVAVLSFFDNNNNVYIVEGKDEKDAMLKGITEYNKVDEELDKNTLDWIKNMKTKSIDEIIKECFDGDLAVSKPIEIKQGGFTNEMVK